jgi:hypothetical protein
MVQLDFDALNRELEAAADRRERRSDPPLDFDYFFSTEQLPNLIEQSLAGAEAGKSISYYFDLECGGLKLLIKRLIRKATHFLFFRTIESQRNFNTSMLTASRLMYSTLMGMKEQHERDTRRIRSLEERIRTLEAARD